MAILIDKDSRILIQGITGREATMVVRHTLEYGSRVLAGVTPGKKGEEVHGVPVYDTVRQAKEAHGANVSVIYVPPAFAFDAVMEAIESGIETVIVITENIPQMDAVKFLTVAKREGARIIGPNSVGVISPGDRVKTGPIGGDNVERCFVPGPVGVISRSGGMTAEVSWMVKRAGYGVSTAVSIGGDALIGSSIRDLLELFEADEQTQAVVTFSEPGTTMEEDAAEFVAEGGFTKPLISFVAGKFTETLPSGTVFGHAGAIITGSAGKPGTKIARLREAGATVIDNFDDLLPTLKEKLS